MNKARKDIGRAMNGALSGLRTSQEQRRQLLKNAVKKSPVKRKPIAGLALAFVLVLAGITALAGAMGLLDFLHLPTLGSIRSVAPVSRQTRPGDVRLEVLEAASDGLSAHLLTRVTAQEGDGLLVFSDTPEDTGLAEQYGGKRLLYVTPQEIRTRQETDLLWPQLQWEYESARTVVLDISIDLRQTDFHESMVTLHIPICTYTLADDGVQTENDALAEVEVELPLQTASTEIYVGTELPKQGDGFTINALTLTRTDLACYLEVEVEDDLSDEAFSCLMEAENEEQLVDTLPLHGSFWLKVQDGEGRSCQLLSGGDKESLGEEEESVHERMFLFVQRFEAVDSVILTPEVMEQPNKRFDSIQIFLQKQGT